jgi:hypothetical protein
MRIPCCVCGAWFVRARLTREGQAAAVPQRPPSDAARRPVLAHQRRAKEKKPIAADSFRNIQSNARTSFNVHWIKSLNIILSCKYQLTDAKGRHKKPSNSGQNALSCWRSLLG